MRVVSEVITKLGGMARVNFVVFNRRLQTERDDVMGFCLSALETVGKTSVSASTVEMI